MLGFGTSYPPCQVSLGVAADGCVQSLTVQTHGIYPAPFIHPPLFSPAGNAAEINPYAAWPGDVSDLKIPHFMAAGAGDQWPKPCPALETLNGTWSLLGLNVKGLLLPPRAAKPSQESLALYYQGQILISLLGSDTTTLLAFRESAVF